MSEFNGGMSDGPYIHQVANNVPLSEAITYKVKVMVHGDYIRVFCPDNLSLTVTNITDLPETMRWHLTCLLAKEDMSKPVNDGVYAEFLWGDNYAPEGWKDIGWRMVGTMFVVITPEQELIDLKRRYINGNTGSESKSQGEEGSK
jgi:hypothetical protein